MGFFGLAVALYLAWGLILFLVQRRLFYPRLGARSKQAPRVSPEREVWTLDRDGGGVEAWYYPAVRGGGEGDGLARTGSGPALIFAHGNAELIDDFGVAFRRLVEQGVTVLLVEYPGYGRSPGRPSRGSICGAMWAAYDRLAARPEVDPDRIVGFGRSLGGGAICALAEERALAALILQSTFTTTRVFAWRHGLPGFVVRDRFENLRAVRSFRGPVLVAHGTRDRLIPHAHGQKLANAARRGRLVSYDAAHSDCPPDWSAFVDEISAFLAAEELLGGSREAPRRPAPTET